MQGRSNSTAEEFQVMQKAINACSTLRQRIQRIGRDDNDWLISRSSLVEGAMQSQDPPAGPHIVAQQGSQTTQCPFSTMTSTQTAGSSPWQDAMPTPPYTHEAQSSLSSIQPHLTLVAQPSQSHLHRRSSLPNSVSQCPIRLLPSHSPEEIAQYFEIHKHEIPRSHEICVKRYQSNEESIRRLNAKYGDMVNMIEGLGRKHEGLLPPSTQPEDIKEAETEQQQQAETIKREKEFEEWRQGLNTKFEELDRVKTKAIQDVEAKEEQRESHFDRPLPDVRVGESPSRPWGIRVPEPVTSSNVANVEAPLGEAQPEPAEEVANQLDGKNGNEAIDSEHNIQAPGTSRETASPRQIVFNGPVIIGYSAEQAAKFLRDLDAHHVMEPCRSPEWTLR